MTGALQPRRSKRWAWALSAALLALAGCGSGSLSSAGSGGNGNGNGNGGNGNGVGGTTLTGLLYSASISPRSGLYKVLTDATGEARIVNGTTSPTAPRFRFDGKKVAFTGFSSGSGVIGDSSISRLFTVNVDGTGQLQAPSSILYTNAFTPAFSPDGTKLVFVGEDPATTVRDIFTITLGGSVVQRLTNLGTGFNAGRPIYSPDGSKILYVRTPTNTLVAASDIVKMNADGTNPLLLTPISRDTQPNYSPDGSKIVFVSYRDGNNEIYVMNADGTNPVRLTNNAGDDHAPVFSPDGTYIAFLSDRQTAGTFKLYSMKSDGTNVTKFSDVKVDRDYLDWR